MKQFSFYIVLFIALANFASAAEVKKVPVAQIDALTIETNGLLFNNFTCAIEGALMGGTKATAQVSVKNKTTYDLNYTVYIAAFDKAGNLVTCFGLEPEMNIHEAGKVETLEGSGMVEGDAKASIDYIVVKIVVQKPSE